MSWKSVVNTKLLAVAAAAAVWAAGGTHLLDELQRAHDARFAAGRLRQRLVEARLSAQTFLSRDVQDARFFVGLPLPAMEDFSRAMSDIDDRITALERLRPGDGASTRRLRAMVEQYQTSFLKITELYRRQGFADWGLEGEWHKAIGEAEAALSGQPELVIDLLQIRKGEKEYLLRRDPQVRAQAMEAVDRLRAARLPPAASTRLKQSLDRYRQAFDEYASLDAQIGAGGEAGLRGAMAAASQEMEPIVRGLHEDKVRGAARARRRLSSLGALTLLAGLLLGAAVSYAAERWTVRPLGALHRAAQAVAGGRLDVPIPTAGTGDVAGLGHALAGITTSLQRTSEDDREARTLLSAVLEGVGDGVFMKDSGGRYLLVNAPFARVLGRRTEEVLGRTDLELMTPEAAAAASLEEREVLDSGEARTGETVDAEGRVFSTTRGLLRDAHGQVKALFGISREISERRRRDEELKAARDAAEEARRSKTDLLAHVSHEIRTPASTLLGMSRLLLETEMRSEPREYVRAVRESADALLATADELLDFSQVDAGRIELRAQPFDVEDVVAGAVRGAAGCAHEKGLELTFRIDPGVPGTLVGDAARFRQVLEHLVTHAVAFTDQGEVLVSADAFDLGRGQTLLRVLVADTGGGLPADARAKVFEPFARAEGARRRLGETGLGLAISARLAVLLGGRIDVDEAPGGGSIFTFTARLRAAGGASEPAPVIKALHGLSALVVDDNATCRKIVLERLVSWGLRAAGAGAEEAALAAIRRAHAANEPFAVALVDAGLPGGGFELGAQMARQGGLRGPVIYMLAPDGGGALAREAAPTWSLVKPIQPSRLLDVLQRAVGAEPATESTDASLPVRP